jgi:nicotinic acid phosphoribosyltransferase
MAFDLESYRVQIRNFPGITCAKFREIPDDDVRLAIGRLNKVVSTDAYNRTMGFIQGPKGRLPEAYTLTFRNSQNGRYLIANGVRRAVEEVLRPDYTAAEVDFARAFYADQKAKGGNGYFEEQTWREVVEKYKGRLQLKIRAVADGTVMPPGEPVMAVSSAAGELAAHLEPNLLRAFNETAVTTDYVEMARTIGGGRIVEAAIEGVRTRFLSQAADDPELSRRLKRVRAAACR